MSAISMRILETCMSGHRRPPRSLRTYTRDALLVVHRVRSLGFLRLGPTAVPLYRPAVEQRCATRTRAKLRGRRATPGRVPKRFAAARLDRAARG